MIMWLTNVAEYTPWLATFQPFTKWRNPKWLLQAPLYYQNFNSPGGGHSVADLLSIVIEKVFPEDQPNTLTNRESYWINMYDSASFGANTRD